MTRSLRMDVGFRLCVLAILLLSFWLRVRLLSARSLWFDEALEYWVAKASLPDILPAVRDAILHPPLYPLLLHFWMMLGTQEFMLHFLSVIFGLLAVAMLISLGKRWLGASTGLIVGLLAATSPVHVQYAQEAVPYTLMIFGLAFCLYAIGRARQRQSWQAWGLWAATAILCIYSYYGTVIPIVGITLASLVELAMGRQKQQLGRLVLSSIGVATAVLPLMLFLFRFQQLQGPGAGRIAGGLSTFSAEVMNGVLASRQVLRFHLVGWDGLLFWPGTPEWMKWLPVAISCAAAIIGLARSTSSQRRLVGWLIIGWGFYWAAGRFFAYPFGGTRHSLIMSPLLLLVIALGIKSVSRISRLSGALLLAWIIAISLSTLPSRQEDIRSVVRYLNEYRAIDEPIYVYYGAVPAFGYAYGQDLPVFVGESRSLWYTACWRGNPLCPHNDAVFYGNWFRDKEPEVQVAAIMQTLGFWPSRFWLVFSHVHEDEDQQILMQLTTELRYSVVDSHRFEGAYVACVER